MGRRLARIDYAGGRSKRYRGGATTVSGRSRSAPRVPDYAGAAIAAGLREQAAALQGAPRFWGRAFLATRIPRYRIYGNLSHLSVVISSY